MISLFPHIDEYRHEPYYHQLYKYIRDEITAGKIPAGEKLPSLRSLAKSTGLSITTIDQAYSQLTVEGYIESRPQSGYFVNDVNYSYSDGISPEQELFSSDVSIIDDSISASSLNSPRKHSTLLRYCFFFFLFR